MTAQIHQFTPRKPAAANVYPWYRPDPYLIAMWGILLGLIAFVWGMAALVGVVVWRVM